MITPKQIRAARAILGWTQEELAKHSGISLPSINNIEREITTARLDTLSAIKSALEAAGLEFIADTGVNLKGEHLAIDKFDGIEGLQHLLDDVYKHAKDEVLISGLDEKLFTEKLGAYLEEHIKRLSTKGIKERLLICEGDEYMIAPKEAYRKLPKEVFSQTPYYVYGSKLAFVLWGPPLRVIIIENAALSESYKKQFEFYWGKPKKPGGPGIRSLWS